jgi:hypothetical protein
MGEGQIHYIEVESGNRRSEHRKTMIQRMRLHMSQSGIRRNLRYRLRYNLN